MIHGVNYNGPEWAAIERWLLDNIESKTKLLVSATTHDDSNKMRGAILAFREVLNTKPAANQGR